MASNVDAKLLKQTKFPPEFSKKVDMTKVNIEVMKKWIAGKLSELLGDEDDVIIELCFGLLESSRYPDIKALQIQLTGFLDKDTPKFCQELWNLCLSAQSSPQGVPKELLEAKKLELKQEKLDAERAAEEARRRKEQERERERELESIRQRERTGRNRGFRDNRGGRGSYRRDSRSPRRHSPEWRGAPSRREFDTYVPRGNRQSRRSPRSKSRSVSRSPSLSRSPPRRSYRSDERNRRRPRSASRSPSPDGRDYKRSRRRSPPYGDGRDRSAARNESSSRSPSPRRTRRRYSSVSSRSPSRSPSPPRNRRRHDRSPPRVRRNTSSVSASRSRSRQPDRNRRRRSSSRQSDRNVGGTKADIAIKGRSSRDDRRLSRSTSSRRDRSVSRSVSRSPSPRGDRKRRRSLQRYATAAKRRYSDSPQAERQKPADAEDVKMQDGSDEN